MIFPILKITLHLNAIYPRGDKDGYVAKYNENGELQWTNTFGGALKIRLMILTLDSEGNIIVLGKIVKTATFSDGGQLELQIQN